MASEGQSIPVDTNNGSSTSILSAAGMMPEQSSQGPKDSNESTRPTTELSNQAIIQAPQPNPRLLAMQAKKTNLDATLATLQAQKAALVANSALPSGLNMPDSWTGEEKTKSALSTANAVIKEHISLLHKYNEIKDIAQGLMGLVAESRGVRVKVVMEEFGMGEGD